MGRYLEDFEPGMTFETHRRTITETDVVNFAGLTGDWNPVHSDETYAAETQFGGRIAHGPMAIGIAFGLIGRLDLFDGTVLALRKVEWSFRLPVRIGDTLRLVADVVDVSAHPTARDRGRLSMRARFINQGGAQVSEGHFTLVIRKRPA